MGRCSAPGEPAARHLPCARDVGFLQIEQIAIEEFAM